MSGNTVVTHGGFASSSNIAGPEGIDTTNDSSGVV
jgi:hypothetical protein